MQAEKFTAWHSLDGVGDWRGFAVFLLHVAGSSLLASATLVAVFWVAVTLVMWMDGAF